MDQPKRPASGTLLGAWAALLMLAAMVTAISLAEDFVHRGPPPAEMAGTP